ncbi:bifunctional transcriptional activator/DNA repair enzyme AdaA [Methylomusa anaerophila]|uniref:Bifunctional transcriptional activator/DNA repair enzyme AdaA n=2 Tax=Methylomusa anaerophila TaxID=1930071 RepID=A0A348AH45_9FIRM|nr:bifunctional transcriptional activator/DNA repair enzyme AdaA [Methylomusa anaerophila]
MRYLMLSETNRNSYAVNHLLHYSFDLLAQDTRSLSIRYIHNHYVENISMETLARIEHYNVSYYGQWFRKNIGVTPQQYIHQLRIDEAKRLLQETDFSISDIAHQIGYKNQSHLTQVFKKLEGLTPNRYKKLKNI